MRLKKEKEKNDENNKESEYHDLSQPVRTTINQENNIISDNSGVKDLPID